MGREGCERGSQESGRKEKRFEYVHEGSGKEENSHLSIVRMTGSLAQPIIYSKTPAKHRRIVYHPSANASPSHRTPVHVSRTRDAACDNHACVSQTREASDTHPLLLGDEAHHPITDLGQFIDHLPPCLNLALQLGVLNLEPFSLCFLILLFGDLMRQLAGRIMSSSDGEHSLAFELPKQFPT